ncbi:MAG: DNA methyltransferase [Candidatus Izemoplasmatales bacterium]|jgi:site-specific DNA-methyltransferase (adenine-specific)|nr:DNA methyltransferase [Candidatus Izemoplasmatales bacterium]
MNLYKRRQSKYYQDSDAELISGDSFEILKNIKSKSIDMIFADPPYFLSGDGITVSSGRMVSVKKADWDEKIQFKEKHKFNKNWIRKCRRILKDNGTIWISGTMHNIYSIGSALEEEGFKIINNITWVKTNPPPNISCRAFTHSTETILWAKKDLKKSKHLFNYKDMKEINQGKQMKDVWYTSLTKKSEKSFGKHPTQKPLEVIERIILASTNPGDIVLDPFNGSGTTGVASILNGRKYVGIDNNNGYLDTSKQRILDAYSRKGLF